MTGVRNETRTAIAGAEQAVAADRDTQLGMQPAAHRLTLRLMSDVRLLVQPQPSFLINLAISACRGAYAEQQAHQEIKAH